MSSIHSDSGPKRQLPALKPTEVRILPLGGLGEIGMNCMIIETQQDALVIDCGVMFSDLDHFGINYLIPDFKYLQKVSHKLRGYLLTHGHEDHIGALPFALRIAKAPLYSSGFTRKLIEAKSIDHMVQDLCEFKDLEAGKTFQLGSSFSITPHHVNHSIIEALALMIDTPQGLFVHTGDFKIDKNPYYGKTMDMAPFEAAAQKGVKLLMSDSTNVERKGFAGGERDLFQQFEELISSAQGLTFFSVFASNISRIGQIVELAQKYDKKIAILGRTMEQNTRLASSMGYLKGFQDCVIDLNNVDTYERKKVVILTTGSQGEFRSGLVRLSRNEFRSVRIKEGDQVILSSKFIPGNEKAIGVMLNQLFKQKAIVHYEPVKTVHVSGHANADELQTMFKAIKPQYFLPVHGEYRHLVLHRELVTDQCGLDPKSAVVAINGEVLQLDESGLRIIDELPLERIMIQDPQGEPISKDTLRERRKLGESGCVTLSFGWRPKGSQAVGKIIVDQRGFVAETDDWFENVLDIAESVLKEHERMKIPSTQALEEHIRASLYKYFTREFHRKPQIICLIMEYQ